MKKFSIICLVLLMMFGMTACTKTDKPTESETPTDTTSTSDDIFYFAVAGEPRLLDPSIIDDSVSARIITQIYYPMFTADEDGNLHNEACTAYEVSEDGLTYTFHFDPNNKWSDGKPVTAEDYIFGWKRSIGMGVGESMYSHWMADFVVNAAAHSANMDDVADMDDIGFKAIDEYTVEVQLHTPCPYYINTMVMTAYLPQRSDFAVEHESTWANSPEVPTNGAYKLQSLDATTEFVLVKNEYFAHADDVKTNTLVGKVIADMDAQLMAFQTGEIQYANSLNADVIKLYDSKPELIITKRPAAYYLQLNGHTDSANEALKDARVRRAIQLGIDRQAIVTALDLEALYYELNGFVPKGIPGVNGDWREEADAVEKLVYTDKEQAKALLAEAGYDENNHLKVEYYTNSSSMNDLIAEIVKAQLAEVNIDVTIKNAEVRTFFEDRENGVYEMCRGGFSADYYEVSTFADLWATNGNGPVTSVGDEEGDKMLEKAKTMSGTERLEYLHEIETYIVRDQAWFVPLIGYGSFALISAEWTGNGLSQGRYWYVEHTGK